MALGIVTTIALASQSAPVLAIQYGSGTYGACSYSSCSISISSASVVTLNVTPSASGSCTIQQDIVSVSTDNSSGYSLTLANASTNTALLNGAATIGSTAASQAGPATLTVNHWGYRVDGVGGFGPGPTTAQSNASIGTSLFAGVPASNASADTLANTSSAANPAATTNVWYGVCANTGIASGTYTTQITYTAVTN